MKTADEVIREINEIDPNSPLAPFALDVAADTVGQLVKNKKRRLSLGDRRRLAEALENKEIEIDQGLGLGDIDDLLAESVQRQELIGMLRQSRVSTQAA